MYTIGIYPRKSVYRDNSDSVQVQIQLCKDYAAIMFKEKEVEYLIYDKDEGFSGKNTNRPSFRELMQDVTSNRLNAVIVYKLDRISRNVQEFSAMYEIFLKHQVSFISVKESFDTTTPMGRTVMYILAAFAQLERENTSERVTDNMQALGASGKWTGGKLPTGMTSVRRSYGEKEHSYLVVDNHSIELVKTLYGLALHGYPLTKIERHCRDNGIHSQSGNFLTTSQIYSILTNPVYCQNSIEAYDYFDSLNCSLPKSFLFDGQKGLLGYGKTKSDMTSQRKQAKRNWCIAIGIHDPVIPAHDWIATQNRLGINKMIHNSKHSYGMLKGIIFCSCGARIDVRTYLKNGIPFSYYYCTAMVRKGRNLCNSHYVRIEEVERVLLQQLKTLPITLESPPIKKDTYGQFQSIEQLKQDIKQSERSLEHLTTALTQALDSPAAAYIIIQINRLDKEKKILEQNLQKAALHQESIDSQEETQESFYQSIRELQSHFHCLEYRAQNELLRKIVKSCIFDGKSLRIVF